MVAQDRYKPVADGQRYDITAVSPESPAVFVPLRLSSRARDIVMPDLWAAFITTETVMRSILLMAAARQSLVSVIASNS